jgi:hypothetical protein
MTRRRKIVLLSIGALGLAAAIFAVVYQYFSPHDPVIGELRFSDHLLRAYTPFPWNRQNRPPNATEFKQHQTNLSLRASSRRALSKAGPEVLPLITNWLATDTPSWKSNLQVGLQARGYDFPRLTANRRSIAWQFLAENPMEIGSDALPLFAIAVTNGSPRDAFYASQAISRLFGNIDHLDVEASLRILLPLYQNLQTVTGGKSFGFEPMATPQSFLAMSIERCIQQLDPQYLYRPLLVLELGPTPERVGAAMNLADFPRFPGRAIPLLITNLNSTNRAVQENCARALGKFGPQARPALPALTNLLTHPRDFVRLAASNAITSITQSTP